jgi:large subunit ribosomal protein L27
MAKKKASAKGSQHVSPEGKRLGPKVNDGEKVKTGMVLVRQHGSTVGLGKGVAKGRDFTIYAIVDGVAKFGKRLGKKIISVK